MATLYQMTKIDRNTIADGDKLANNISAASANDYMMVQEVSSTLETALDVYNTVNANSANNWDNSHIHNFSTIIVNDNDEIRGKSRLTSKLTLTAEHNVSLKQTDGVYELSASPETTNVSSYYKYAHFDADLPIAAQDVFSFESQYFNATFGSVLLHESFVSALNGFVKSDIYNDKLKPAQLFITANKNNYALSATTDVLEYSDGLKILSHTTPTQGSFLMSYYAFDSYKGASIVNDCSFGISQNVYANHKSMAISVKCCSAENYSFLFGDIHDMGYNSSANAFYYTKALDHSISLGTVGYANGNSLIFAPYGQEPSDTVIGFVPERSTHSAMNNSMMLMSDNGGHSHGVHAAIAQNNSVAILSNYGGVIDNSICIQSNTGCSAFNKSLSLHANLNNREAISRQTYDRTIGINANLTSAVNSLCINIKGEYCGSDYKEVISDNSVILNSNFANILRDITVKNSILIHTSYTSASENWNPTTSASLTPLILNSLIMNDIVASGVFRPEYSQYHVLANTCFTPAMLFKRGPSNASVRRSCCIAAETLNYSLDAVSTYGENVFVSHYQQGYHRDYKNIIRGPRNLTIKGCLQYAGEYEDPTVRDYNLTTNDNLLFGSLTAVTFSVDQPNNISRNMFLGGVNTASCVVDSVVHGYSHVSGPVTYGGDIFEISGVHALQQSRAYASMSMAIASSNNNQIAYSNSYAGKLNAPAYMFAFSRSITNVVYNADGSLNSDARQLSMFSDKLTKQDLPITQFETINTITDVDSLATGVYYVIG